MIEIIKYLEEIRLEYINEEIEIHNAIKEILNSKSINYNYEYKLGKGSRIDFYLPEYKCGIEVKKKRPNSTKLYEQLSRYLGNDILESIIIVSEGNVSVPKLINNKDVYKIQLNKLWF